MYVNFLTVGLKVLRLNDELYVQEVLTHVIK